MHEERTFEMKPLYKIIDAVCAVCDVSDEALARGSSPQASQARQILAYVAAMQDIPTASTAAHVGVPPQVMFNAYLKAKAKAERRDDAFASSCNLVMRHLRISAKVRPSVPVPHPITTYTDEEELAIARACEDAVEFFKKFGRGEQPLKAGHPISRQSQPTT